MARALDKYFQADPEQKKPPRALDKYFQAEKPKEQSFGDLASGALNKAGRLITQGAIGGIQRAAAPFDIPVIAAQTLARNPLIDAVRGQEEANPELAQKIQEKQSNVGRGLEQAFRKNLEEQDVIRKESKVNKFVQEQGLDVGSLIELGAKKLGVDLEPKGVDEMALRWIGFIKDPSKSLSLIKNGANPAKAKDFLKAILPTAKEAGRGIGAATALNYAAENELGPIGSMLAAVIGDMAPSLLLKGGKGALTFAKNPKEAIKKGAAKTVAAFTPRDKSALQEAIIKDFKDAGLQADLGTISGSNIIKWVQSTLNQSGLTGAPLEAFKESLSKNIVSQYKKVTSQLGESIFQSHYDAGKAAKEGIEKARDSDLGKARELYRSAKERGKALQVFPGEVSGLIKELEAELEPGSFKSTEQKAVLDILNQVKKDVMTPAGDIKAASIPDLINNKIALNDTIDYEIQGGTKKLLRRLVKEIDDSITSAGKDDPIFAKQWKQANKRFSEHAKVFRGKTVNEMLKLQNPAQVFAKMNTPHGIEETKKALSKSPEGIELFKQLSAYKMEELIGKNMVDGLNNQVKFGTFSKLLEKGENRRIVKSLLGENGLKDLENLQRASGRLAETAQKFLNTSRSGVHGADIAYAAKILIDLSSVLSGNVWPLAKSLGGLLVTKQVAKLISDPEFIKIVEELITTSRKPNADLIPLGLRIAEKAKSLAPSATAAIEQTQP